MATAQNSMTAAATRRFLETCNDQIEAGMSAELARRIREANAIVAADIAAVPEARAAAFRARRAVKLAA